MPEYLAPGVYVEEVSFRSKSIEGVSTTTTGFVGMTRTGPYFDPNDASPDTPELLTSFGDFERIVLVTDEAGDAAVEATVDIAAQLHERRHSLAIAEFLSND